VRGGSKEGEAGADAWLLSQATKAQTPPGRPSAPGWLGPSPWERAGGTIRAGTELQGRCFRSARRGEHSRIRIKKGRSPNRLEFSGLQDSQEAEQGRLVHVADLVQKQRPPGVDFEHTSLRQPAAADINFALPSVIEYTWKRRGGQSAPENTTRGGYRRRRLVSRPRSES
jgi:hypothetical protein